MMACAEDVLGPNLSGDVSAAIPIIDLGPPGGSYSNALGVNNRGQLVGESETASGELHGFFWGHEPDCLA
ncbi:MAG: hypothetical protein DMG72_18800 [Acidobacteria bacterium]|nr:MAG: hypothetical protein DMG72_18800 [Acidobacteriota bacterium]